MTTTLAILGASGDLTERLLLPGLGSLLAQRPDLDLALRGTGRSDLETAAWDDRVRTGLRDGGAPAEVVDRVVGASAYERLDPLDTAAFREFLAGLGDDAAIYFALPPEITQQVCAELTAGDVPAGLRLVLEKPFGHDQRSAQQLNATLAALVPEDRVFRVDHFLGMSTVLNLIGLRVANPLLAAAWDRTVIERIDIVFDETLALEGRAAYYDGAGALVDMLQSHLLVVAALLTMNEPQRLDPRELRDLMAHALGAMRLWGGDPVAASRRARYAAGRVGGREVPAYADEEGVDGDRATETLAEVTLAVATQRWAGVPVRLRSGKALAHDRQEVVVTFHPVAAPLAGFANRPRPNRLRFDFTTGALELDLATNGAGSAFGFETTTLRASGFEGNLEPYGQVLAGVLDHSPLLAMRADVVEECWRIIDPVRAAWARGDVPLETYAAGSDGSAEA